MTAEAIGFYGCNRGGYFDLWNCGRTLDYVRQHSWQASRIQPGCCPDIEPYMPGAGFLLGNGAAGSSATSPDSVPLSIVGDTEIVLRIAAADWSPPAAQYLLSKWVTAGNQRTWAIRQNTNGSIDLLASANGGASTVIGSTPPDPASYADVSYWVKVTIDVNDGAGGKRVRFYYAYDTNPDDNTEPKPFEWHLWSDTTTAGTIALFDSTAPLRIGGFDTGAASAFNGKVRRVIVRNGIDGPEVFDMDFAAQITSPGGQTVFAESVHAALVTVVAPAVSEFVPVFGPYTNPIDDDAWWWDANRPESAGFFGMQVTKINGLTSNTMQVTSYPTARCDSSIGYEPAVSNGYTLTFEAVLHGLSCCSVAYGLRALRKALSGCCGDAACSGTRLRFLSCLPQPASACGSWVPPTETTSPWRTLVNAKMTEHPNVVAGSGASCGTCGCKPVTKILFTMQANAEMFLDAFEFLPETGLTAGLTDCVLVPCAVPDCAPDNDFLDDPNCATPILVEPADTVVSCFCPPLFRAEQNFVIDLGGRTFDSDLEVIVHAGSVQLQNLEVLIWTQSGALDFSSGLYTDCNPCNGFTISYVPANSILRRDMCGVRVERPGVKPVNGASVFAGIGGRFHDPCLRLASCRYIVSVRSDGSATAPDATIEILAHEVEP